MSCESCKEICLRRNENMTESHKKLCAQNEKYATIWDKKYGVVNESIIPDSFKDLPGESNQRKYQKALEKTRKGRNARRTSRTSALTIRAKNRRNTPPKPRGLGDVVETALSTVGITEERVSSWLGRPCGCKERRDKLNRLSAWARRIVGGETENAEEHLEKIVGEDE